MLRAFTILATSLLLSFGLIACQGKTDLTTTLTIEQSQLQAKVAGKFPMTQSNPPMKVHLSNPKLVLTDGSDRLGLNVNLKVDLPTKKVRRREVGGGSLTGTAFVTGKLNYDKSKGIIYFEDGKIDSLKIDQLPPELAPQIKTMANEKVGSQLSKVPVFTLDDAKLEQQAAKALLQSVKVEGGALQVVVGYVG